VALVAAALSLAAAPLVPAGVPVLIAAAVAVVAGLSRARGTSRPTEGEISAELEGGER
jgi:hypothetical protein